MHCNPQDALNVCSTHPSRCSEAILGNSDAQEHACQHQHWTQNTTQLGQRTFGGTPRPTPMAGQTLNVAMRTQAANEAPSGNLSEASHPMRGGQMQPVTVARASHTQRGAYETLLACDQEGRYKQASELVQRFANRYDT